MIWQKGIGGVEPAALDAPAHDHIDIERLALVTETFVGRTSPVEPVASSSARLVPTLLPPSEKLLRLTPQPESRPAIKSNERLNRTLGDKARPRIVQKC